MFEQGRRYLGTSLGMSLVEHFPPQEGAENDDKLNLLLSHGVCIRANVLRRYGKREIPEPLNSTRLRRRRRRRKKKANDCRRNRNRNPRWAMHIFLRDFGSNEGGIVPELNL
ncbi:hypothetical protein CEXT_482311 [Caerostris extrusa]|uniref:Uncharacterized protein n=1 Tax=Caerostris extrusa TaxID=172846 RepID=A0AAV4P0S5_CAEEX|nr:hypothetical protein CEXT_482311 [Caerostris extrusa]